MGLLSLLISSTLTFAGRLETYQQVCWIPILKSKKLILAGDPRQLPPTILSSNQHKDNGGSNGKAYKVKLKPILLPDTMTPCNPSNAESSSNVSPQNGLPRQDAGDDNAQAQSTTPATGANMIEVTVRVEDDDDDSVAESNDTGHTQQNGDALHRKTTELRPPKTLETTLFDRLERLYGPGIKKLLAVQYR